MSEDDPTGETEVCLEGDIESAQPYTVQLAQMPSGDNPATGEYTKLLHMYTAMQVCRCYSLTA